MAKNFTYIVCSLHGRSGKTLLSRLLADYLILQGDSPDLYDTDAMERKLSGFFPSNAIAVDIDKVLSQMQLFDALASSASAPRIVDISHQAFGKFFRLMRETGFVAEAREHGNEPVIFYIVSREADSYTQGLALREAFRECNFVVVENEENGQPDRVTQNSPDYQTLMQNDLRMQIPALDPMFVTVIEDPYLSLSGFMQDPPAGMPPGRVSLAYMSLEARHAIRGWMKLVNIEIHRIRETLRMRAAMAFRRPL